MQEKVIPLPRASVSATFGPFLLVLFIAVPIVVFVATFAVRLILRTRGSSSPSDSTREPLLLRRKPYVGDLEASLSCHTCRPNALGANRTVTVPDPEIPKTRMFENQMLCDGNQQIVAFPPLAYFDPNSSRYELSMPFRHILQTYPSQAWLVHLRDCWKDYAVILQNDGPRSAKLRRDLLTLEVECQDGNRYPLSETCLPPRPLPVSDNGLPVLEVPEPENSSWSFLSALGVLTRDGAPLYIFALRHIKKKRMPSYRAEEFYQQLQNVTCPIEIKYIKEAFDDLALIYIPESPRGWLRPLECIWNGPETIRYTPMISQHYPGSKMLFCGMLGIKDATVTDFLREAEFVDYHDPARPRLFRQANELVSVGNLPASQFRGHGLRIFPVHPSGSSSTIFMASLKDTWFIADTAYFHSAFQDIVHLLDASILGFGESTPLFQYFGLETRLLSRVCHKVWRCHKTGTVDSEYTRILEEKSPLINSLLMELTRGNDNIKMLERIKVRHVDWLQMRWEFAFNGIIYASKWEKKHASVTQEGGDYIVSLKRQHVRSPYFPIEVAQQLCELLGFSDPGVVHEIINRPSPNLLTQITHGITEQAFPAPMNTTTSQFNSKVLLQRQLKRSNSHNTVASRSTVKRAIVRPIVSLRITRKAFAPVGVSRRKEQTVGSDDSKNGNGALQAEAKAGLEMSKQGRFLAWKVLQRLQRGRNGGVHQPNSTTHCREGHGLRATKTAAFEITEPSNDLIRFIHEHSYFPNNVGTRLTTKFYIDVHTTAGGIEAPFDLTGDKLQESVHQATVRNAIYLWIRLYQANRNPQISVIIDPPSLLKSGHLQLSAHHSRHVASLQKLPQDDTRDLSCPSSVTTPQYKYEALPRGGRDSFIRLVTLLRNEKDPSILSGKIFTAPLSDLPRDYVALSYTWGPSLKPYVLHTPQGAIDITTSLYFALRDVLRHTSQTVTVWVDAICINQADDEEKISQIQMLRDIFKRAHGIFGWLGSQERNSNKAINIIRTLANNRKGNRFCGSCGIDASSWAVLSHFLDRPYFQRTWIIQEVVFARSITLICGPKKFSWDELYEAVQARAEYIKKSIPRLQFPDTKNNDAIRGLGLYRRGYQATKELKSLLFVLGTFQYTKATLRRDKLFGLLNLSVDFDDTAFQPDYSEPDSAVLHRYGRRFVEKGLTDKLLYRAGSCTEPDEVPSWIPDWTSRPYPQTISSWPTKRGRFHAAGATAITARIDDKDVRNLVIKGRLIDTLEEVGHCSSDTDDILAYLKEIARFSRRFKTYYIGRVDALPWRLAVADAYRPPFGTWERGNLRASYEHLRPYMDFFTNPRSSSGRGAGHHALRLRLWPFVATVIFLSERMRSTVVAASDGQYLCLVPEKALPGDKIAIFNGCSVPFLLRKNRDSDKYWLLGECYVHGIMHGAGMNRGQEQEICLY